MVLLRRWVRDHWLEVGVHAGALAPLVRLVWLHFRGLFVDPVRQVTTRTGRTALVLLVLTLACTPITIVFGWKRALRARRALGLYAFAYVSLHFLTFAGWDYSFRLDLLGPALFRQSFVVVGLASLVLLLPLAITSTSGWRKRLGRSWQWLHRLFYPAIALAVLHFLRLSKDPTVPLRYGAVVFLLLVIRLPWVKQLLLKARRRIQGRWRMGRTRADS